MRDLFAVEQHLPARGLERAGDQIDEAGLARSVWTEEGAPRAALQGERDVAGDAQRAEAAVKPSDLERRRRHRFAVARRSLPRSSNSPRSPRRANKTERTSSKPAPA